MEGDKMKELGVLLTDLFPRYGAFDFNLKTIGNNAEAFVCETNLFGQVIAGAKCNTESEAKESAARLACAILTEYSRTIFNCQEKIMQPIFAEVMKELRSYRDPKSEGKDKVMVEMEGEGQVILSVSDAMTGKLKPLEMSRLNSVLSAERAELTFNPVNALYEYAHGRINVSAPVYDIFTKSGCFGCLLKFNQKEYLVEAIYKKKSDAKYEVSRVACEDIFGFDKSTGAIIAPKVATAEEKKEFAVASTVELLKPTSTNTTDLSTPPKMAFDSGIQLPAGRRFITVVNEVCQKHKLPAPHYDFSISNDISSMYACRIANLFDKSFDSAIFGRKQDAKEDAAHRLFYHMLTSNMVDTSGRAILPSTKTAPTSQQNLNPATQQAINPATAGFFPFPFMPNFPPQQYPNLFGFPQASSHPMLSTLPPELQMLLLQMHNHFMSQAGNKNQDPPN